MMSDKALMVLRVVFYLGVIILIAMNSNPDADSPKSSLGSRSGIDTWHGVADNEGGLLWRQFLGSPLPNLSLDSSMACCPDKQESLEHNAHIWEVKARSPNRSQMKRVHKPTG